MRVYTHRGWAHPPTSQHSGKPTLTNVSCTPDAGGVRTSGSLDLESNTLPIEPPRHPDKMATLEIRTPLKLTLLVNHAVFRYSPFDNINRYNPFENISLTLVFGRIFSLPQNLFSNLGNLTARSQEIADSRVITHACPRSASPSRCLTTKFQQQQIITK